MFALRILNYLGMMCKLIFRAFAEIGDVKGRSMAWPQCQSGLSKSAVLRWFDPSCMQQA